jgi:hypothetical protein
MAIDNITDALTKKAPLLLLGLLGGIAGTISDITVFFFDNIRTRM